MRTGYHHIGEMRNVCKLLVGKREDAAFIAVLNYVFC
jgi:hypothetical protein